MGTCGTKTSAAMRFTVLCFSPAHDGTVVGSNRVSSMCGVLWRRHDGCFCRAYADDEVPGKSLHSRHHLGAIFVDNLTEGDERNGTPRKKSRLAIAVYTREKTVSAAECLARTAKFFWGFAKK